MCFSFLFFFSLLCCFETLVLITSQFSVVLIRNTKMCWIYYVIVCVRVLFSCNISSINDMNLETLTESMVWYRFHWRHFLYQQHKCQFIGKTARMATPTWCSWSWQSGNSLLLLIDKSITMSIKSMHQMLNSRNIHDIKYSHCTEYIENIIHHVWCIQVHTEGKTFGNY